MKRITLLVLVAGLFGAIGIVAPTAEVIPQTRDEVRISFAPIVKQASPAVVNVYSERVVQDNMLSFFEDLFGRQFGDLVPREQVQKSLGSGVIVSGDGYIVTNYHVVEGGTDIVVVLADRRSFEAQVVLQDEGTDLAILKIDAGDEELPWLELGDSDDLEVGDLVLAIGNPFGIGQTVTSGIVSALARASVTISDYEFFIQTDAAINPGNSGGPLIDTTGRVVGINTAIYSRSGGSHGIGFAIPSNMVKVVIDSARQGGVLRRPWIGVTFQEVTQDIAETQGLDLPRGALVVTLHPLSPLLEEGLSRGDILLSVNGHEVHTPDEVAYRFATVRIGEAVRVVFLHDGESHTMDVEMIVAPEEPARDETLLSGTQPFSGAVVANLSPALAEELGLAVDASGVIVLDVYKGIALQLGLQPGDIILSVEGEDIASVDDLEEAVDDERAEWEVSIQRGDRVYNSRVRP